MKTIKGPGLFLAQFAGDSAPFNTWEGITGWAAGCGSGAGAASAGAACGSSPSRRSSSRRR